MSYTAINIQGNILSSEILEKIRGEDIRFQSAKDFGLGPKTTVREEINDAWRLALSHWGVFKQKQATLSDTDTGTTETRNYWMKPLLNILGYELTQANAEIINGKSYQGWIMEITEDALLISTGFADKSGKDFWLKFTDLNTAELYYWDTRPNEWVTFTLS